MSGLFSGGGASSKSATPDISLRIQTSVQGQPMSLGWGRARIAGNLIWYGDFVSTAQHGASSGGKGGGGAGTPTGYNYSAAIAMGLCQGPISSVDQVYENRAISSLGKLNMSVFNGSYSQDAWGYLTSLHPDAGAGTTFVPGPGIAFRGLAYIAAGPLQLGSSSSLPNFSYEVTFGINSTYGGIPDVNPSTIVTDFLTNQFYGAGFPADRVDAFGVFDRFCLASGLFFSPTLTSQTSASQFLQEILTATNSEAFFSGGSLQITPYWDFPVDGYDVSYVPNLTPVYDFGPDDFLATSSDPISIVRRATSTILNAMSIEYLDRANSYNPAIIHVKNEASITSFGLRSAGNKSFHMICIPAAASLSAQMQLGRESLMNEYTFTVPSKYILTNPMDIVTLTSFSPSGHGLNRHPVRVKEMTENDDGSFTILAIDLLIGTASPSAIAVQPGRGARPDHNELPGDVLPPKFFEPPYALSGAVEVWGGISGAMPAVWGGCEIWVSSDNLTYDYVGRQLGPSRMGALSAPLSTPSAPPPALDVTNTLSVDVSSSLAALQSASDVAAQALGTICWVDGEVVAYANATPTSAFHYDLTRLVRGAYGTTAALVTHPTGSDFIRIDSGVFKVPYQEVGVGSLFYVKFLSFNRYGGAIQSLASVSPYTFTPSGSAFLQSPLHLLTIQQLITKEVKSILDLNQPRIAEIEQAFAAAIAEAAALAPLAKFALNKQSFDHRTDVITRIDASTAQSAASIASVSTVAQNNSVSIAALSTSVSSQFTTVNGAINTSKADIITNATAISTANAALSSYEVTTNASVASTNSTVSTQATALASLNTSYTNYTITTNASLGSLNSSVSTQSSAIATLNGIAAAKYAVTLNSNGYASGFSLLNGGAGFSNFVVVADKFQVQLPGYNGSAPVPVFGTGLVGGVPSVGINGNLFVDGSLYARSIVAGQLTSDSGVFGALSVKSLSIGDNAITATVVGTSSGNSGSGTYVNATNFGMGIDTTGLAGKVISVLITFSGQQGTSGSSNWYAAIGVNGGIIAGPFGGSTFQPSFSVQGVYSFTASGGYDTFSVQGFWNGQSGMSLNAGCVTTATAVKR
jgi:hypothetical protein